MRTLTKLISVGSLFAFLLLTVPVFAQDGDIIVAGELFVDLDADDPTADLGGVRNDPLVRSGRMPEPPATSFSTARWC